MIVPLTRHNLRKTLPIKVTKGTIPLVGNCDIIH